MQATEELRTTTDVVQAVKQHDERRYSIKVGDEWYSDFGVCPAMKGDFVEVGFSMNGRYRNIRNVRVVAASGAIPRADKLPVTQPERTVQAVEFVTISPEEEDEIQRALAARNATIVNESIETARQLLSNRVISDAVTAGNVVRLAVLLAERRIVHVSRVYNEYLRAKLAAMRAPPAPPASGASRASPFCPPDDNNPTGANNVDDPFDDGNVVFRYTDDQAVDDGILKRFLTPSGRDTRHRITGNAYERLTEHHKPAYPQYTEGDFMRFYLAELLPLIPEAVRVYEKNIGGGILKTDFDFRVTKSSGDVLWYIPNEIGGVTMMKPEDY